jgi:3',5'-nucleoside bisphosphate phosphatase
VIDLHLHTTASDGRCTPGELVTRAAAAGLTVMAATDHDTTSAVQEVAALALAQGIVAVPGIEITAVHEGADVHVLGYFLDIHDTALQAFLARQREIRIARVERIAARLAELGLRVDMGPVLAEARRQASRAVGRPQVARALVDAGLVASVADAFDTWLGRGCPAFVPRAGESPEAVVAIIHAAHGLASLAHPGRTGIDERIPALGRAGLDALEAFHSDHDEVATERYRAMAERLGLLVTGGSDFHDDPSRPSIAPGSTTLPADAWERLAAARARHA